MQILRNVILIDTVVGRQTHKVKYPHRLLDLIRLEFSHSAQCTHAQTFDCPSLCKDGKGIPSIRHLQIFEYKSNDGDHCVSGSQQTMSLI